MNKKTSGVVLSYLLLGIDILVGIFFVPFLLGGLGDSEYGLYKLMHSTASYLSVLDFGIGSTITRYVIKYRTENKKQEEENFIAMGMVVYGALALTVLLFAGLVCCVIPEIYSKSISSEHMRYAQMLFLLMCTNTAVGLFNHAYNGLLMAYDSFVYIKLTNIVKICLRVGLLVAVIGVVPSAMTIVIVDLALSALLLTGNAFYSGFFRKCRIRLHIWDKKVLAEAFVFTSAILLQSIINQFNSNVDNVILGIYSTTATVAVYSVALQLFTMYSSLSTAVSSVYLPSISRAVFRGETVDEITQRVIVPSRIQLMVLLLALTGFLLFGRDFVELWIGNGYTEVYILAAVLLTTSTLQLSQNTITSVLKARNILHGKTAILLVSTLCNLGLTVVLVPRYGAIGAVIGTAASMIFGYGVALGCYYQKKAGLNMSLFYRKTYPGIMCAAFLASVLGSGIEILIPQVSIFSFLLKAILYVGIYCVIMILIGLNDQEKQLMRRITGRFLARVK